MSSATALLSSSTSPETAFPTETNEEFPPRVALTGPAGVGKTTHAKLLRAVLTGDVLSFASPLKKIVNDLFSIEQLEEDVFRREALQCIGVAARGVDSQVWVRLLLEKISNNRPCFVDDCRFYNEYAALKHLGFTFVRLSASPKVLAERRPSMTPAQWAHESEQSAANIPGDLVCSTEPDTEWVHDALVARLKVLHPNWKFKRSAHAPAAS